MVVEPVRRRLVRGFEDVSKRWAAGLIDPLHLSVAKNVFDYEGALFLAIGTFAGILHGGPDLGGLGSVNPFTDWDQNIKEQTNAQAGEKP